MNTELAVRPDVQVQAETLEKVLLGGNLAVLSAQERMTYYKAVCESVGLNPLTRPFEYLNLNGKLVLYARREATEQLRKIHGVSVERLEKTFSPDGDLYIVEAQARDRSGRADISTAAVSIKGLAGEMKANTLMKCETKAKRRVTLSICGLGMLDETEVDSIRGAVKVPLDLAPGEIPAGDDVPAVDVRADVDRTPTGMDRIDPYFGGKSAPQTPEAQGGSPTTTPEVQTPPSPLQTQKPAHTKRYDAATRLWLEEAAKQKRRLGKSFYYEVLGGHGFEHADDVSDRETRKAIYADWKKVQVDEAEQESLL